MGNRTSYILPGDPETWGRGDDLKIAARELAINLEDFAQQLIGRWSSGKVDVFTAENRVDFQLPEPRPDQDLPDGGDGALIYGCIVELYYFPIEMITDFALWYRRYIPSKHVLFIGDAGGGFIELGEHTSAQDIRRAYGWKD